MFEISVRDHFDAAHFLVDYEGKCERLHGHRFGVVITLRAHHLDNVGLAYDFQRLKGHLRDVLGRFDHVCLNEVSPFDKINPSSENIAQTIYEEIKPRLGSEAIIVGVQVYESPHAWATYTP